MVHFIHQVTSIHSHSVLILLSNVKKVTRSSFNLHFTPDDGLWFRPKYPITSSITLFIQPTPFVQLPSGSKDKNLATYNNCFKCTILIVLDVPSHLALALFAKPARMYTKITLSSTRTFLNIVFFIVLLTKINTSLY